MPQRGRMETDMLFRYLLEQNFINVYVLTVLSVILCIVVPYFLGSLNFGIILSRRLYGEDVRAKGSGNAGSTNMLRNYGKKAAGLTLLGDALKTVVSCAFGIGIYGVYGAYLAGLFCILGHMFPVYFRFKGGKGIVCLAVMILMTDWRVFLILFAIFLIIVLGTKYVSLGSVIGAMLYPLILNRINRGTENAVRSVEFIAIVIACFVVFMHRENIKRLYHGTESKLSFRKKKKEETAKKADGEEKHDGR